MVQRALGYALVVGAVLILIKHGDAVLRGDLSMDRLLRMRLTVVVPYVVSTLSSVGAMRAAAADLRTSPARPDLQECEPCA